MKPDPSPLPRGAAGRSAVSRSQWRVVFMLRFVCFFNCADRQAICAVFPKLRKEFGFDKVQLGLIGSAFMCASHPPVLQRGRACEEAQSRAAPSR